MNNDIIGKIMDLMAKAPWLTASIAKYAIEHDIDIIAYEKMNCAV